MKDVFKVILLFVVAVFCLCWGVVLGNKDGYRQGQIDAANGNMKYKLTTQPSIWVEKKETQ